MSSTLVLHCRRTSTAAPRPFTPTAHARMCPWCVSRQADEQRGRRNEHAVDYLDEQLLVRPPPDPSLFFRLTHAADTCVHGTPRTHSHHLRAARSPARSQSTLPRTSAPPSSSSGAPAPTTLRNAALLLPCMACVVCNAPALAHRTRGAWPAAEAGARSAWDAPPSAARSADALQRAHRPTRGAPPCVLCFAGYVMRVARNRHGNRAARALPRARCAARSLHRTLPIRA